MFAESDIICKYTRQDALNDGILVDVTEMAKEAGFKCPVAITHKVHCMCQPPKGSCQSYDGRLWDVLWMCKYGIKTKKNKQINFVKFMVKIGRRTEKLKVYCHPGDEDEMVMTIMEINED